MKIIGLTGRSGSGKGFFCEAALSFGIRSVDTDKITHGLYLCGKCADEIGARFEGVQNNDGSIDRKKLGNIVFSDKNEMRDLQDIVYKYVSEKTDKIIESERALSKKALIVDAPMLYEAGFEKKCDYIIALCAPDDLRIKRIVERDKISADEALKRLNSQKSDSFFREKADFVIENDGRDIKKEIEGIFEKVGIL